jgi:hypothetical protein
MSRALLPKRAIIDPKKVSRAIENSLTGIAQNIYIDFRVTTQTWRKRPAFTIKRKAFERVISTDDSIYAMLDAGTKAHTIRAKRAKVLRFGTPFRAKTLPSRIMSQAGGSGSAMVFRPSVRHPGTKARRWARAIQRKWQKRAPAVVQRALDSEFS